MPRYQKKRDANELAIVKALRARGVAVYRIESSLDPGVFDLLCEYTDHGINALATMLLNFAVMQTLRLPTAVATALTDASDALRQRQRVWVLLEIKNMDDRTSNDKRYLRVRDLAPGGEYHAVLDQYPPAVARKLRRDQADFLLRHRAPRAVVTTVAEALRACGLEPEPDDE